jgi:hypothetical protein
MKRVVVRVPAETEWGTAVRVELGRRAEGTVAVGELVDPVLPVVPR